MAYYLKPFATATYAAFLASRRDVVGVRPRYQPAANKVNPGDMLICYLSTLSCWTGLLEVISGPYREDTPLYSRENDPSAIRLKVRPLICLRPEQALPLHDHEVWRTLSFTHGQDKKDGRWRGMLTGALTRLSEADGAYLVGKLCAQSIDGKPNSPVGNRDQRPASRALSPAAKEASAAAPRALKRGHEPDAHSTDKGEIRESLQMQALIAKVGAAMGMRIWIPKADRAGVLQEWPDGHEALLDSLPLSYDEATLRTIEQIDVLWLKGHSIVRAFEVEHTTSIYSGILRMADLIALQPNMEIKLHIVAPDTRRNKVFQELTRPVFSQPERRPLAGMCTYLSYESLRKLAEEKHLAHLVDSVLEEYAEDAG